MTGADTHTALSPPPTRMCVFIKFIPVVWGGGGMYSKSIALLYKTSYIYMHVRRDLPLYLGREDRGEGEREGGGMVDDSGRWILCSSGGREGGGYRYTWDTTCKQVIQY